MAVLPPTLLVKVVINLLRFKGEAHKLTSPWVEFQCFLQPCLILPSTQLSAMQGHQARLMS